MSNTLN